MTVNQTLTSIVVSPAAVRSGTAATQQFTAIGQRPVRQRMRRSRRSPGRARGGLDQYAAGCTRPRYAVGTATVTATSGGVSGTRRGRPSPTHAPTVATAAAATPAPVTGTTCESLRAGRDDDGGEANLTYTWTSPARRRRGAPSAPTAPTRPKNTTATFTQGGQLHVPGDDHRHGRTVDHRSVNVTVNQTLTALSSARPAQSQLGGAQQFTATAKDQFGSVHDAAGVHLVTAAHGSINASGLVHGLRCLRHGNGHGGQRDRERQRPR